MRLRRVPNDTVFFAAFVQLASHIESAQLVLAELSGVEQQERGDLLETLQELSEAADESCHLVARQLRENYVTPLDREDIFALADALRDVTHRLAAVGSAMAYSGFDDLPPGAQELLGILSAQVDQTTRMTTRLRRHPDQWEYADAVSALTYRARSVRVRTSSPSALGKQMARAFARMQLGEQFEFAAEGFAEIGRIVARIAAKES